MYIYICIYIHTVGYIYVYMYIYISEFAYTYRVLLRVVAILPFPASLVLNAALLQRKENVVIIQNL